MMGKRGLYIFISVVILGIIIVAMGGGIFQQNSPYFLQWQHHLFSNFCHQDPARSLWLSDQPMAVCSRCFGIYLFFGAGWFLLPVFSILGSKLVKRQKTIILVVITANMLDIVGNFLGFWQNTLYSRLALGGLLGLSAVMLFANEFRSMKTNQTGDVDGTIRTTI